MDRRELEGWLAEGRSLEWIGRQTGKHPSTVGYWVRKLGLEAPNRAKHAARGRLDREVLADLIDRGMTVREIATAVDRSTATVRHWLRQHGLQTARTRERTFEDSGQAGVVIGVCAVHGEVAFAVRSDGGHRCLQCRSAAVSGRRRRLKEQMVAEAGGRCVLCGYDRSVVALQFHHRDPATKLFSIAERGFTRSLEAVRVEASKCVLLCANCHAEVEAGVAKLPEAAVDYPR